LKEGSEVVVMVTLPWLLLFELLGMLGMLLLLLLEWLLVGVEGGEDDGIYILFIQNKIYKENNLLNQTQYAL